MGTHTPRGQISLNKLLSGIVILSFLLIMVIAVTASYQSEQKLLHARTLEMNYSSASRMATTVDTLFSIMRTSLAVVADQIDDKSDAAEVQRQLEFLHNSRNYFNSIVWVDEQGFALSVAPTSLNAKGKRGVTEAVKQALASRQPELSAPYMSSSGRMIVLMSEPVFNGKGDYIGFIGGTIYLQEHNVLNDMFGDPNIDKTGTYYYVVDSGGKVVYHPDKTRIGKDVSTNEVVRLLMQGQSGQKLIDNTYDIPHLSGYATVSENKWGIVVQSPVSMVAEQQKRQVTEMIFYMITPFLLVMAITVFLARRLAAPFVNLANLVNKASAEAASLEIPDRKHWNREADQLARAVISSVNEMHKQNQQLAHTATIDPLTGLQNRRSMRSVMEHWMEEGESFGLVMIDVDRFKMINDNYGHQAGDEVLRFFAQMMQSCVQPENLCCRWGGEEFVILVPGRSPEECYPIAEQLRESLERTESPIGLAITISVGIAGFPHHSTEIGELFECADKALYEAKKDGRNRTVIYN
ncbi:sensor domain-containing diguanylate cyclase [Paenibacillus sp. P96]|uniref:Sensor domain-containing diguanylate cyclase n=1 Tax=Paenibacillus zeirhizosphaerae TaxID=2987519 RepID=A0ABT9FUW6_9BACL|nr:sensor domain-containing diguanylate cyclase [Paenibacillus sp. P96]MDP4098526.1 sensor domain-containing diguanylate cyclase [Paenibacillus sp. P96]